MLLGGSLELFIQTKPPGQNKELNWLGQQRGSSDRTKVQLTVMPNFYTQLKTVRKR
jgi:hypothetical protein